MFSIKLEGFDTLARDLRSFPEMNEARTLRRALRAGADVIRAEGAARAPRAPGAPDYADHFVISGGRGASVAVGPSTEPRTDEPSVTYGEQGLFLEFGTVDMDAQPHLGPAFDQVAQQALEPIKEQLWRSIVAHRTALAHERVSEGESERGTGGGGGLL